MYVFNSVHFLMHAKKITNTKYLDFFWTKQSFYINYILIYLFLMCNKKQKQNKKQNCIFQNEILNIA